MALNYVQMELYALVPCFFWDSLAKSSQFIETDQKTTAQPSGFLVPLLSQEGHAEPHHGSVCGHPCSWS